MSDPQPLLVEEKFPVRAVAPFRETRHSDVAAKSDFKHQWGGANPGRGCQTAQTFYLFFAFSLDSACSLVSFDWHALFVRLHSIVVIRYNITIHRVDPAAGILDLGSQENGLLCTYQDWGGITNLSSHPIFG